MKKRYMLLFTALLACCLAFSGCGKDKKEKEEKDTQQTVDADTKEEPDGDVVTMEQNKGIDKSKITKYLGTKSATSGEVVITNRTGREISEFYMRPTPVGDEASSEDYEGDSWGADLIQGKFTLKDKEQALLYYNKENTDSTGSALKKYDLQVSFKDMDPSENCFFRELDLTVTEEYVLQIDDGIPYVKFTNSGTKRQESTLAAAKERMGIEDEGEGPDESEEDPDVSQPTATPQPTQTPEPTEEPQVTVAPPEEPEDPYSAASEYVGKTLDQMVSDGRIGSAPSIEYVDDEATGTTIGYHYYDGYTVYTVKNDDGSETVTGVY